MRLILSIVILFSLFGDNFDNSRDKIYTEGEYIFSLKICKNSKEVYLKFNEPHYKSNENNSYENAWELGNEKNIEFIGLELMNGTINNGQKTIRWNYYNVDFNKICEEVTGLVETDSTIWLHPPRTKYFKILEINPFPEIRLNTSEWSTDLTVGSQWGNKRWKTWKENLIIPSKYKYDISTSTVVAEATTEIGKTKLVSQLDPKKGFTKFDYTNIDGSRIVLELVEIRK